MRTPFQKADTIKAICEKYNVSLEEIQRLGRAINKNNIDARESKAKASLRWAQRDLECVQRSRAYYAILDALLEQDCSYSEIGRVVGRDHTTIMSYCGRRR